MINFPLKAKYKRMANEAYYEKSFKDNEIIEFAYYDNIPSAYARGYAWYKNKRGILNIVNIKSLEKLTS